jgi:5-methylcytosine-specific restriction endonuclease McrA
MKRTKEDRVFSRLIRERDEWTCQRCGKVYPENHQGLHCAHIFSRARMSTRHDMLNAVALCYGCHRYLDTNPQLKRHFFRERLGHAVYDDLEARSRRLVYGGVA